MRQKFLISALLAAAAAVAPAGATTVTFSSDTALPSYITNSKVLADFSSEAATNGAKATFNGAIIHAPSSDSEGAQPKGSEGNYLAVLGGTSYTLDLSSAPAAVVSFIEGSIDSYNQLVVSFTDATPLTLSGSELGSGDGRLTIDTGSITNRITQLVFSSSQNSYEVDTIVSSAPEAATWMLMILGFGVAGAALRGRKERTTALA